MRNLFRSLNICLASGCMSGVSVILACLPCSTGFTTSWINQLMIGSFFWASAIS